jgi:predicted ATP-dependent endonuclease of OLD family
LSEKLIIRNFGPITNVDIDLRKVNVLIGDQGTGKSIVAKILIAVKNCIFHDIFDLPENKLIDRDTQKFIEYLRIVGVSNFLNKDSFISYTNSADYNLQFNNSGVKIKYLPSITLENLKDLKIFNFNYIPAERNMVSVLADSLYALLEVKAELPTLFLRFGNKYQTARKSREKFDYDSILGISFAHKNGKDYVLIPNGTEINLSDSSSGIQGGIALLSVFDFIVSGNNMTNKDFSDLHLLVIEEPELNCFPETQNKLINYIVENNKVQLENDISLSNENDFMKNQLVFTTHSPYILTSLNNLMYAHEVGKIYPDEAEKVIERKYWLNPNDVSAYELKTDGTCEDIFNREENLIGAEKIDEISNTLNEQFDALLNIELVPR